MLLAIPAIHNPYRFLRPNTITVNHHRASYVFIARCARLRYCIWREYACQFIMCTDAINLFLFILHAFHEVEDVLANRQSSSNSVLQVKYISFFQTCKEDEKNLMFSDV